MKINIKNNGSVLLVTVFAIALLTAFVVGMLEMNSEQIQIMKNEIFAAQATAIANAGIADVFAQLRTSSSWSTGFSNKSFGGGSYTAAVTGTLPNLVVTSTGTSAQSFTSKVQANITVGTSSPYIIRIDQLRINQ
jgi:c-di-AMP phosphodiesterase-like protein